MKCDYRSMTCHVAVVGLLMALGLVAKAEPVPAARTIVIGFVGGRVHADNERHLEVRMAQRLAKAHPHDAFVQVFANHDGDDAFRQVMLLVDANQDGELTSEERGAARVVIYGHSWGATQTVTLAQQLKRENIPVLLTVQVDTISKSKDGNGDIPSNVAQAINFYQPDGWLHGQKEIRAADPSRTEILGNIRSDYKIDKVDCHEYSWFARTFMKPHIEIENDAKVWDRIQGMIEAKIAEPGMEASRGAAPRNHRVTTTAYAKQAGEMLQQ